MAGCKFSGDYRETELTQKYLLSGGYIMSEELELSLRDDEWENEDEDIDDDDEELWDELDDEGSLFDDEEDIKDWDEEDEEEGWEDDDDEDLDEDEEEEKIINRNYH